MNVRLNVGGTISTFKCLVVRTPNNKEKTFLSPRASLYCYALSSLRGTKPAHTRIKSLSSFLSHFDSPRLVSGWAPLEPVQLSSQMCGAGFTARTQKMFPLPHSPWKSPVVCSAESISMETVDSILSKVWYLWTLEEPSSWGRIIMFILRKSSVPRIVSKPYFQLYPGW